MKKVVWVAARQITQALSTFLLSLMLARYLGPGKYGVLALFMSLTTLMMPLAIFGLDKALLRELVVHPGQAPELLRTGATMRLLSGLSAFVLAMVALYLMLGWTEDVYRIGLPIALTLVLGTGSVLDYFFQAQQRFHVNLLAIAGGALVAVPVAAVLISFDAGLPALAWLRCIELSSAALVFIAFFMMRSRGPLTAVGPAPVGVTALAGRAWPFLLSALAVGIYARIDQVMLGRLGTYEELGLYSVAVKLTEIWYIVPSFIVGALTPSTLRLKGDEAALTARMSRLYQIVALVGIAGFAFNALLGDALIVLIFGKAFQAADDMLLVLSATILFAGLGGARTTHILASGHDRLYAVTTVLGMLVNVVLNFLLIPRYGGLGAAWATVVAQFVAAYASCFFFAELRSDGVLMTKAVLFPKDVLNREFLRSLLSFRR